MLIISSISDIEDYVTNYHGDFVLCGMDGSLIVAIMVGSHPDYGSDWGEWLGEAIEGLRDGVLRRERDLDDC